MRRPCSALQCNKRLFLALIAVHNRELFIFDTGTMDNHNSQVSVSNGQGKHDEGFKERMRCNPVLLEYTSSIRGVLASLSSRVCPEKPLIPLGHGDATYFKCFRTPPNVEDALVESTRSCKYNGYAPSYGFLETRRYCSLVHPACAVYYQVQFPSSLSVSQIYHICHLLYPMEILCAHPRKSPTPRAVADYVSLGLPFKLTYNDVYLTVGCSQAIQVCLTALATKGSNILLPRPGFPVYETVCGYNGIEMRFYDLIPEKNWEVDLDHVKALADDKTIAMVTINPSNPCGAVFSNEHLLKSFLDVLDFGLCLYTKLAEAFIILTLKIPQQFSDVPDRNYAVVAETAGRLKLPLISDEVYAHMAFGQSKFVPMATFAFITPVITLGGLSKRWLIPGWRFGWLVACDPNGVLKKGRVQEGVEMLMNITPGPSSIVQENCITANQVVVQIKELENGNEPSFGSWQAIQVNDLDLVHDRGLMRCLSLQDVDTQLRCIGPLDWVSSDRIGAVVSAKTMFLPLVETYNLHARDTDERIGWTWEIHRESTVRSDIEKMVPSIKAAVPSILQNTSQEFHDQTLQLLEVAANNCYERIQKISSLSCHSRPQGSMFIMVKINVSTLKDIKDDMEFAFALVKEESVLVLPGSTIGMKNWIRISFGAPSAILEEAFDRIELFCQRHSNSFSKDFEEGLKASKADM
eukprot:Gb_04566 [translate_table: standard]